MSPTVEAQKAFVLFQSSLPMEAHQSALRQATQLGESTPHDMVPTAILEDPEVLRAVERLIGAAKADACRHVHVNNHPQDGDWHQDDYDGGPWPEGEWAILFYFPQETPLEMGGTSIMADGEEVVAAGPAGTCLLAPGDVVHRARANTTGRARYMLKYLFRRDKHDQFLQH